MFHKIEVNGPNACELYKFLRSEQPAEDGSTQISWNFAKFLVDREGRVVKRYSPRVTPEEIAKDLPALLGPSAAS